MSRSGRSDLQTPVTLDDKARSDFAQFGVTIEEDEAETPEEDVFAVWQDNWISVLTFLACETQWRTVSTMTRLEWLGLDYTAVDVVMRRKGIPDDVFEDLRIMEQAALETFGEIVE